MPRCCAMQASLLSQAFAPPEEFAAMAMRRKLESARLAALAQQSFLRHGGNQRAVAREDEPAREAARAGQVWALLCVEQPVVGAERTMQPQRMVEARRHDAFLEHRASVRDQRGVEQRQV